MSADPRGSANRLLDAALEYASRGWPVFPLHSFRAGACTCGKVPCSSPGKHPRTVHGVKDASTSEGVIREWWTRWPDANIGIATGTVSRLVVTDVDPRHGGEESLRDLLAGRILPCTPVVRTGGGGRHYYFAAPTGRTIRNKVGTQNLWPGLDWRGDGGYVVAPPSLHISGTRYGWMPGYDPSCLPPAPLPDWTLELLDPPEPPPRRLHALQLSTNGTAYASAALRYECAAVSRQTRPGRNDRLNRAAFNLGQLVGSGVLDRGLAEEALFAAAEVCGLVRDGEAGVRATIKSGMESGIGEPRGVIERGAALPHVNGAGTAESPQDAGPNPTDLGNAERFSGQHGDSVRYCHPWGAWMIYDGARWTRDRSGEVVRRYKETVRGISLEAYNAGSDEQRGELLKHARQSESQRRITGALDLAKSERSIAVLPEAFDSEATRYLLNVRNGTLDLRGGELRPHSREDLITRLAPVNFDPQARCPVWCRFLDRVVPDGEVRAFLQRFVGYSLTGTASEQVFCLLYGTGANGKSTFLETLIALLGDYGYKAEFETFLESRGTRASNKSVPRPDVLALVGRRLVVAIEAAQGRRLDTAAIKELTGGDTITARGLYHNEQTSFRPAFAFFLAANHRPEIPEATEAAWRRVLQVPFTVTIPEDERDHELLAKLTEQDELAGILGWALEGCRAWLAAGLVPPRAVRDATAAYRVEQDAIAPFLEQRCRRDARARTTKKDLREAYHVWCGECDEEPLSDKAFARAMEDHGFQSMRDGHARTRTWVGLRLSDMLDGDADTCGQIEGQLH